MCHNYTVYFPECAAIVFLWWKCWISVGNCAMWVFQWYFSGMLAFYLDKRFKETLTWNFMNLLFIFTARELKPLPPCMKTSFQMTQTPPGIGGNTSFNTYVLSIFTAFALALCGSKERDVALLFHNFNVSPVCRWKQAKKQKKKLSFGNNMPKLSMPSDKIIFFSTSFPLQLEGWWARAGKGRGKLCGRLLRGRVHN